MNLVMMIGRRSYWAFYNAAAQPGSGKLAGSLFHVKQADKRMNKKMN